MKHNGYLRGWQLLLTLTGLLMLLDADAQMQREKVLLDSDWEFAFGDASSPQRDFGCGTEYFNYLTKAASIHNEGPYSLKFDKKRWGVEWHSVDLPYDWVVDLEFSAEASHSHGYKCVGYNYPEQSVGWYRKVIDIPQDDQGKELWLQFDGIFRDSDVWFNGFYLGGEASGYAAQIYDITEYVNFGAENLITVRVDATLEEGWFYEGAGIYRHVWLNKAAPLHFAPYGIFAHSELSEDFESALLSVESRVRNRSLEVGGCLIRHTLNSRSGEVVASGEVSLSGVLSEDTGDATCNLELSKPRLWSVDDPYRYRLTSELIVDGEVVDAVTTPIGVRRMEFDPEKGFLLNGKRVWLKGVNLHQDHAGVGVALPDELHYYRLQRLKELGCNACRSAHNPMTSELLDACDSLGFVVIEENRLAGINEEHRRLLRRMIERDRNHPSIALWSVGNEEWGMEWSVYGERIVSTMREICRRLDPTREVTVASSSGPTVLLGADVAGYNYLLQNPIDRNHEEFSLRPALGSEETTGCGTRGVYFDDTESGHMAALNRRAMGPDSLLNSIERGMKFYAARPWLGGVFYWTGFDYRGEPNPLKYPATGSQYGVLDYCGFYKDEAYYLKSWWSSEPTLHILPHWNLQGHEGEKVSVWVYSNCEEVELWVNGESLGRKTMPRYGHLEWQTQYQPGELRAVGYCAAERTLQRVVKTSGEARRVVLRSDKSELKADGRSLAVVEVELQDAEGNFVPNLSPEIVLRCDSTLRILGAGNGDPAMTYAERPKDKRATEFSFRLFNGRAQILLLSRHSVGDATLEVEPEGMEVARLKLRVLD